MKIAISGGTGFIGGALVRHLAQAGHELVVLTRNPQGAGPLPPGSEAAFFDATKPLPPENLRGAEAVVHLAGENLAQRWTDSARQRILDSRVNGTGAVLSAAIAAGTVRTFVSASAVGYYGDRGAEPMTESSPPGDDFAANVCRAWEAAARPAQDAGLRLVVMRLGVVLHPEGGALAKMLPIFRAGFGGRLGRGHQFMSWIHRRDVLRFVEFALRNEGLSGPYNVTSPDPVSNRDFTLALGKALRRPTVLPAPSLAIRALYGEMGSTVLGGQRVLPERALKAGFAFDFPSVEGALKDLLARR